MPERLAISGCVFAAGGGLSQRIQSGGDRGLAARAGTDGGAVWLGGEGAESVT